MCFLANIYGRIDTGVSDAIGHYVGFRVDSLLVDLKIIKIRILCQKKILKLIVNSSTQFIFECLHLIVEFKLNSIFIQLDGRLAYVQLKNHPTSFRFNTHNERIVINTAFELLIEKRTNKQYSSYINPYTIV